LFENFESGSFRLEAPERNAVMWNATTPILGDSPVAQGKKSCDILKGKAFAVNGNNFTIDFAELKKCSNFAIPMRFEGVAVSRALGAGDADVKGTLTTGAKSVAHTSRMTVEGFGVEADENAIIEARMHQENNVMPDAEPFPALTTSNCTAAEATGGQCDAGALNVTFRLTALKEGAYSLGTSSVLLNTPISVSPNSKSLKKLESVQGEAFYLVPIEKGEGAVDVSAGSLKLQRNVTVGGEGFAKNETNVFPAGWDTCNGFIEIKYEPAKNPPFTLGKGCTDLGFRVSTIFPADAVFMNMSIPEYGNVITRSVESDGSDKCYEVCEIDKKGEVYGCEGFGKQMYSGSQYLVRYSPETRGTCDKKFKARGNKISGSQVKIEFAYTGDATAKRSLVLHVFNDQSEKSLYISPVYSLYGTKVGGGVETLYPQLWAVTNLKQLGKRSIVFMKPSNMLISFEGPGTKLFAAYYPPATAQKQMVAYESTDLEKPIFAFGDTSSEVKPISRYGEALVAKQQQFEVDSPQAQALSELLQDSLSENAFLQKDAADSLSTAVQRLAKRTVYWRSNDVTRVCQQTPECVSSYYTLEGCCRDSVEEWKNYTTKIIYNKQSCVFCNNTKNPDCNNATVQHLSKHQQCTYQPSPSVYQCDQRCSAKAVLTPETIASLNQIELGGTGVTINAMSGAKLPYGESIEGRKCTLEYASTNAFSLASDALASRQYAPYNPKRPKEKITVDEIEKCISNGNCPLVLIDYFDQTTQSPRKAPQCTEDKNADGLMEEGEQLHNATYASPQALGIQTGTYTCASPRVVAVDKAAFFAPALQGDKITPKTEISDFEVEYCQLGACPLVLAPQSASTLTGSRVVCFRDVNGNGFVDESINSEMNSMEPAQPMSWTYAFQRHTCPQGKQIAVIKFCLTSCGSYCYTPNCDPDLRCKPSGTKDVPTTEQIREFKGWLNQSSVAQVKIEGKRLSRGRAFLPAAWFQDLYGHADGKPVFSHSFVVNSKKAAAELASLSTVSEVIGCGPGSDYPYDASLHTNEGVYEVRDFNVIDARGESWSAQANAMTLPVTNYLAETKADTCRKTRWDARLCERSYPDKSPEYGACFNSILQFQASAKKLGAEAGADLVGGLGYGVKNGLGYGVAPNGHVFALLEPGTTDYTCRGENKWKIERQRLYHWTPVGKPETQQFQWETDLGCNGDCGCKSGGGYGSVLGILGAIVGIFCPVCGAIIGAVGQVVDSGAGGGGGGGGGFMGAVTDGVVQTISSGAIGLNCKQWGPFGEAVVYACKGLVWQISGAG
ncbi:hypothetical protein HZC09_01575, partial [Candidatus Micrarchaeota archaeon]|nr:hypothetical protein [Candidatus Micrarchaeota archaeon]